MDLNTLLPYAIGAVILILLSRFGVKVPGLPASPTPAPPTPAPGPVPIPPQPLPGSQLLAAGSPLLALLFELLKGRIGEKPDQHDREILALVRELLMDRKPDKPESPAVK